MALDRKGEYGELEGGCGIGQRGRVCHDIGQRGRVCHDIGQRGRVCHDIGQRGS